MKLTLWLMAILVVAFPCLQTRAQTNCCKVSIQTKKGSVIQVLQEVEKQTGYGCTNTNHMLDNAKPVTISVTNADIKEVLEICSRGQYFILVIEGNQIVAKPRFVQVFGVIKNELEEPVKGVSILAEGNTHAVRSGVRGEFSLGRIYANALIKVTADNINPYSFYLEGRTNLVITVKEKIKPLKEISIVASTGYQYLYRKSTPSSFFVVTNHSLQQQSGNTISERMSNISLGVLPTVNEVTGVNQPKLHAISVRSTLFANPDPLYVVDNFPYVGDINQINPDDILDITILKDAAATALWGSRSGNGVVVITTKAGKYARPHELTINSSFTIGAAPNLFYYPVMDPKDKTEFTRYLFGRNFYSIMENSAIPHALPSAVENLIRHRKGEISDAELSNRLQQLEHDVRIDKQQYFYRRSLENHFSAQLSAGTENNAFYLSAGYDHHLPNIKKSWTDRKSLSFNHNYKYKERLDLSTGIWYLGSRVHNLGDVPEAREPLVDANGNYLTQPFKWRQPYIDTAGGGKLLNWDYVPLADFDKRDRTTTDENIRLKHVFKWKITKELEFNFLYQHQRSQSEMRLRKDRDSYEVRNLINSFTQRTANDLKSIIPYGDILDLVNTSIRVNNFRPQLVFGKLWRGQHDLKLQAGTEFIQIKERVNASRTYGYDENKPTIQNMLDHNTPFRQYADTSSTATIPVAAPSYGTQAKYISHFAIANYNFRSKINVSASARLDKTKLTPAITSDQYIRSYSTGIGWNISSEPFYKLSWFSYLKLRASLGTNGNAPITTILTPINQTAGTMYNNINQQLKRPAWESVRTINFGFDVCTKNNLIEGSIDAYQKVGSNLIAFRALDPVHRDSLVTDNLASTKGYGVDVVFYSKNINRGFRWSTKLLFSFVDDRVVKYHDTTLPSWVYCEQGYQSIVPGKPLYSIFSYRYGGLDGQFGNPLGYLNGHKSDSLDKILTTQGFKQLRYHGRSTPKVYGNLINEFSLGTLSVSVIVSYKFGYYFRRNSINYYDLMFGLGEGSPDYALRWKEPGDELKTNVPSRVIPESRNRDLFYNYSEVNVERGDHIRLQAINTSLDCKPKWLNRYRVKNCTFYLNVNNIGIIWRANRKGIDPDRLTQYPNPTSIFAGFRLTFK